MNKLISYNQHLGRLLTQQSSKGNGRRESCKVNEYDSSHALGVEGILEVTQVFGVTVACIPYGPAEQAPGPPHGVVYGLTRGQESYTQAQTMKDKPMSSQGH